MQTTAYAILKKTCTYQGWRFFRPYTIILILALLCCLALTVPVHAKQVEVKDALLLDPAADSYEIMTKADNGVVTLTGAVDSWNVWVMT